MMELPPLEYTLDNVVLGWREEAVSFAREHGYHLIVNSDQRPFHYFQREQDIKSNWYEGIYQLGIQSLLPVPFEIQTVGLESSKLKIVTEGNTKVLINFGKLHIFDLDNFANINVEEVIEDYIVYDFFDVLRGSKQRKNTVIDFENSFVKTASFVPSNRMDQDKRGELYKDIITKSIVEAEDIKSFDFSETVVRLLLTRKLKELGIKAPSKKQTLNLKIDHSYRHYIKNTFSFNVVGDLDNRVVLHE